MDTRKDPKEIAESILGRSVCSIKVGACIEDGFSNVFSWGWNSQGLSGYGEHAEASAIRRANKSRLAGATIYVAGERERNYFKPVNSRPCSDCLRLIESWGLGRIWYRDGFGMWRRM